MLPKSFTILLLPVVYCLAASPVHAAEGELKPQSHWRNGELNRCLTIGDVSKPLTGSDECSSFSGTFGKSEPVAGYACAEQKTIGFFAAFKESDNSIKPDFFLGSYSPQSIFVQYCVRISNDWPPEFSCQKMAKFEPVTACDP